MGKVVCYELVALLFNFHSNCLKRCEHSYCALLTRGANLHPTTTEYPSTAPDSLRHWTATQKRHLDKSETGTKLLEAESKQQDEWRQKYNSLSTTQRDKMTYGDFQWAMEAVHSRAFRGDFGGKASCATFRLVSL